MFRAYRNAVRPAFEQADQVTVARISRIRQQYFIVTVDQQSQYKQERP